MKDWLIGNLILVSIISIGALTFFGTGWLVTQLAIDNPWAWLLAGGAAIAATAAYARWLLNAVRLALKDSNRSR